MPPTSRLAPWFLLAALASPAAAQLSSGDSLAVIRTVQRYHDALVAGDTTALRGMLSYGAVVMNRGFAGPLKGRSLASAIEFDQAVIRRPTAMVARIAGGMAYVYTVSTLSGKGAPPGSRTKNEAESIFLSRLGKTWFIELVHITVIDAD